MGLFSSETKVYVGTSINRVIKDSMVPDSVRAALASAIYKGEDILDNILEASISSLDNRAERMYSYAGKNSSYGLPSGELYSNTQGGPQIQAVLDALEGQPVLIDYRHFGNPNLIHMAWMELYASWGYSPSTNTLAVLSSQKGVSVYLEDLVAEFPATEAKSHDPDEAVVWGNPPNSGYTPERQITSQQYSSDFFTPTAAQFIEGLDTHRVKVTYVWQTKDASGVPVTRRESQYLAIALVDRSAEFFHVKYQAGTETKYWMYKWGSGTHPTLDAVFVDSPDVMGDFYPNIYFRLNKTNLGQDTRTSEFKVAKKMAKYLGFDYSDVNDAIHENPDVGDVEQAFMTLAVPADSDDPGDVRYLYDFFDKLYIASEDSDATVTTARKGLLSRVLRSFSASKAITIKDKVFEMNLVHNGLFKVRKAGVIGAVGTLTKEKSNLTYTVQIQPLQAGAGLVSVVKTYPCRYYRKQISAGFYDEIQVVNLAMKYNIRGRHNTLMGDNDGEILLVPLDRTITKAYNARDAEKLYARSLHIVCNSYQEVKVKWYQQGWFSSLVMIVGVVLTIASMGADGGSFTAAAVAITAGAYMTLAYIVAMEILYYMTIKIAFKLFVKAVGVDLAFLAAIAALAFGVYEYSQMTDIGAINGQMLLQTANGLTTGINMEMRGMYNDLLGTAKQFDLYKEEKMKLLDTASELLGMDSILSPVVVLGEDPSQFYKRTVHSGNIGAIAFDDIHNYVGRSLQLPDFSMTIGGLKYGL